MPRRYQYKSKIEPVQVDAPAVAPELSWFQPSSQPLFGVPQEVPSGCVLVGGGPEQVHPDATYQQPIYPYRKDYHTALAASGCTVVLQEVVDVSTYQWRPEYPDIINKNKYREPGQQLLPAPDNSILQWRPEYPDRVYGKKPVSWQQYAIDPQLLTQPETVSVDKWFRQQPTPIFSRARQYPEPVGDLTQPVAGEDTFVGAWGRQTAVPPRGKDQIVPSGAVLIGQNTEPPADTVNIDWAQPTNQPVRRPRPVAPWALQGNQRNFAVIQPSTVGVWGHSQPQPDRVVSREYLNAGATWYPFTPAVVDWGWYLPTNQPTRRRATVPPGGIFFPVNTNPETVSLDRFKATYPSWLEHPYFMATYVASGGIFQMDPPIVVQHQNYIDPGVHNYVSQEIGTGVKF